MDANIDRFLQLVGEIESNSWCQAYLTKQSNATPKFSFSIIDGEVVITDVPSEPLESALLRVRRLTMKNSPENLNLVYKKSKRNANHPNLQRLYDVWHQYWRLSFIKEPYLITLDGKSQVMTFFKAYDIFINGHYFHSDPNYEVILTGAPGPVKCRVIQQFLKNQFHWTVANVCIAAVGLRILMTSDSQIAVSRYPTAVTDFLWSRHQLEEMKEQYRIFNDWIEQNGGCENGRWP